MLSERPCFLIDNDEDDREIFALALQEVTDRLPYASAASGPEAIALFKAKPTLVPTAIFIDMNMPLMDGLQCLHYLRRMEQLRKVPIFMYSTSSDPRVAAEARQSGANDLLLKPSSIGELVSLLSSILKPETNAA